MTPIEAYEKTKIEGPSDKTRDIVLSIPRYAFLYALDIDKKPKKNIRNALVTPNPLDYYFPIQYLCNYIKYVDKKLKTTIRKAIIFHYNYKRHIKYMDRKYTFHILL